MDSTRRVTHRYEDPLDRVWLACAQRIGLTVERSGEVYASYDGAGRLALGIASSLDADDCLAQMVLHELCHALVQGGREAFSQVDWGLCNRSERDRDREQSCLVTQAILLGRHGLRDLLAPTTEHRSYYDALSDDPLAAASPEVRALTLDAVERAAAPPFHPHLEAALAATARIRRAVADHGSSAAGDLPSLWDRP